LFSNFSLYHIYSYNLYFIAEKFDKSKLILLLFVDMSPPFTTVAPILFSGLMPTVSVAIDGPLSLVKEDKMRQLITTTSISNHPDYPAISGLLSFIKPEFAYHTKTLTTSSLTPPSEVVSEVPLSLSIKNSLSQTPITSIAMNQLSSGHVPSSLSRPQYHQNQQQNITSVTSVLHTPPTAVPVSVVTSVVDHHRGLSHRVKNIAQNANRSKTNEENNTSGMIPTLFVIKLEAHKSYRVLSWIEIQILC